MNETLIETESAESAATAILTWDTDDKCQDEKEPTTATKEIVKISDEAALLNDRSNSNGEDSDNDECTLTTTNSSRTASRYSVIGKDSTEWKVPFSNAGRVKKQEHFYWFSRGFMICS